MMNYLCGVSQEIVSRPDGPMAFRFYLQPVMSNAYYTRVMSNGAMVYQVVGTPVGSVIRTLPVGCKSVRVGNIAYSQCGPTNYQRVGSGYQVVVIR